MTTSKGQDSEQVIRDMMDGLWAKVQKYHPQTDGKKLWDAYRFAKAAHQGQVRRSGEPYFVHALTVGTILADLRLDEDTIIAAFVHDVVEDTKYELRDIRDRFGNDVARMVDGVTKIGGIRNVNREARKAETYRKLVLSIAQDPRTVLIKLADRLHNMRTIAYLPEDRQQDIAQETMDVYAPLAHRFGMAKIKWELEDLAFKVLQPERYFEIESGINQTRAERERLIEKILVPLQAALDKAGVACSIEGRPKHFYSIFRKMQTQQIGMDRVYDLLALRILVETKTDCYHALGILHSMYPPLADRIKDYIATPKPNMYQSLHSTVRVPGGKYIEVQIRTHEMHERSELGIAAHWRYKEGGADRTDLTNMVKWLRQIMEWQEDVADAREFMESLKIDFFQDEVFVFSPGGDVFSLPRGSTPLDFAFRIHSEVGFRCVGAKVNGRIANLRSELSSGDTVEILTSKTPSPSPSWLEIVKTTRAKHHLRRWLKSSQFGEEAVKLGRAATNIQAVADLLDEAETNLETIKSALTDMQTWLQGYIDGTYTATETATALQELETQIESIVKNASYNGISLFDTSNWASERPGHGQRGCGRDHHPGGRLLHHRAHQPARRPHHRCGRHGGIPVHARGQPAQYGRHPEHGPGPERPGRQDHPGPGDHHLPGGPDRKPGRPVRGHGQQPVEPGRHPGPGGRQPENLQHHDRYRRGAARLPADPDGQPAGRST